METVKRIDVLFAIGREINPASEEQGRAARDEQILICRVCTDHFTRARVESTA
jgi:hypothetical protein